MLSTLATGDGTYAKIFKKWDSTTIRLSLGGLEIVN